VVNPPDRGYPDAEPGTAGVTPAGTDPMEPAGTDPPDGGPPPVALALHAIRAELDRLELTLQPGGHPAPDAVRQRAIPAWLRQTGGEPRLPAVVAVVVAIALQLAIPERLAFRPLWLLPALETAMLVTLIVANPSRISDGRRWLRWLGVTLVVAISVANGWSAESLITGLIAGTEGGTAAPLLVNGGAIWLTNVIVFSLWYWELDRGGPSARARAVHHHPDFMFVQMQSPELARPNWEPGFVDYLYLSFTNAATFGPTDVLPLSRWAKMIMLGQSVVSLATVILVIARAVNILR
jgi:uncharacterized membrane protein